MPNADSEQDSNQSNSLAAVPSTGAAAKTTMAIARYTVGTLLGVALCLIGLSLEFMGSLGDHSLVGGWQTPLCGLCFVVAGVIFYLIIPKPKAAAGGGTKKQLADVTRAGAGGLLAMGILFCGVSTLACLIASVLWANAASSILIVAALPFSALVFLLLLMFAIVRRKK